MTSLKLCYVVITAWLGVWTPWMAAQGSGPEVVIVAVGDNVTITAPVTSGIVTFSWYRGAKAEDSQLILTYIIPSTQIKGPQHTGLETGLPDGSLQITDVTTNYSGEYRVSITGNDGAKTSNRQLQVYERLSQPTLVNISGSDFSGDNVTLECRHQNETVMGYVFYKDGLIVACNLEHISCSEHSPFLHFRPIKISDSGSYTCVISNPVSNNTSTPLEIRVKAVPISNVTISSNVSSEYLWENEASVGLTCWALGTDPAYSWLYNDSRLPQDSRYRLSADNSTLTISPVARGDAGPFICTASNSANTVRSAPLTLPIAWRPSEGIQCGAQNTSSEDHVTLSCSWPGGSPEATVRLELLPNVTEIRESEVTLNISRNNISPNATLSCHGNQSDLADQCSLELGAPLDPSFIQNGTFTLISGRPLTLVVNLGSSRASRAPSEGILPATFTWLNGSSIIFPAPDERVRITSNDSFSKMEVSMVTVSDSGPYHCQAKNLIGTSGFSFFVTIEPPPETTTPPVITPEVIPEPEGLPDWAIAVIVVGVLAVLVVVAVIVYCVIKKKKAKYPGNASSEPGDPSDLQMKANPQKDEVNYAVLKFNNNSQQQMPAPDHPTASETLYAVVRKN